MEEMRIPLRLATAGAVLGMLLALLIALAPANADAATIEMKGKSFKGLKFSGPEKIKAGKKIKIVNETDPGKIGPHTFTLVEKKLLPKTAEEADACFDPGSVCFAIAVAHEVDFETEEVGKRDVEAGKKGWDAPFASVDEGATGDSWFTDATGETTKRKLKAKKGTKLTYFCAIHPNMVGTIKVK